MLRELHRVYPRRQAREWELKAPIWGNGERCREESSAEDIPQLQPPFAWLWEHAREDTWRLPAKEHRSRRQSLYGKRAGIGNALMEQRR
jgi:hypothetical protein